ncbi:MAG: hypothetical protein M3128_05230 [Verrucomicrobiota bacterium]|nr:hypothetical protein [Verrucomicrobiota bacterium]
MKNELVKRRLIELGALLLIGEGIMGLIQPRRYSLLWHFGPRLLKAATEELAEHPIAARAIYALEAAAGIAIAALQTPEIE